MSSQTSVLVGVWDLLSLELLAEGGPPLRPLGDAPAGRLIYTPDGHVSATISGRGRPPWAAADPLAGTVDEMVGAAKTWTSYVGRWRLESEEVVHEVDLSFFPNWEGQAQRRKWAVDGDQLFISAPPMLVGGTLRVLRLTWRRSTPRR